MKVIITKLKKIQSKKGDFTLAYFVTKDGETGDTFISSEQSALVTADKIVPLDEAFQSDRVFDLSFNQQGRLQSLELLEK